MAVVVDAAKAAELKAVFEAQGETVFQIGRIIARPAGNDGVVLLNADKAWG